MTGIANQTGRLVSSAGKPVDVSSTVLIGRASSCDLICPDRSISRKHLALKKTPQGLKLLDMESTNGTYVNGKRVRSTYLTLYDTIEFGDQRYTYLPAQHLLPTPHGIESAVFFRPQGSVSSEFFDLCATSQTLVFFAGSVSHSGPQAGYVAGLVKAALGFAGFDDPLQVVQRVNAYCCDRIPPHTYISFFWGKLDRQSLTLQAIRAGTPPALLHRPTATTPLYRVEPAGVFLGRCPLTRVSEIFEVATIPLKAGETIYLFNEPFLEHRNQHGENFGLERAEEVLQANAKLTVGQALQVLEQSREIHGKGHPTLGDLLVMALRLPLPKRSSQMA